MNKRTLSSMRVSMCVLCVGSIMSTTVNAERPSREAIDAAIRKSIPLLETAAAGSSEHRQCFTCHGHAMPVLALVAARDRGFTTDEKNLQAQLAHTAADLARGKAGYLKGRGQGGGHTRAGYALWTLHTGGRKPDDVTAAVSEYLVFDEKAEHWKSSANRPPSEKSPFASTYVALRGLDAFGTDEQSERIDVRKKKALAWLLREQPKDTEDRVFRLLGLDHLDANHDAVMAAAEQLIKPQRGDGGWSQIADAKRRRIRYRLGAVCFTSSGGDVGRRRCVSARREVPAQRAARRRLLARSQSQQSVSNVLRKRLPPRQGPVHFHAREQLGHSGSAVYLLDGTVGRCHIERHLNQRVGTGAVTVGAVCGRFTSTDRRLVADRSGGHSPGLIRPDGCHRCRRCRWWGSDGT